MTITELAEQYRHYY